MDHLSEITDRNYQTISILENSVGLSESFAPDAYLVVIDTALTFAGILTGKDLLKRPDAKLVDLNLEKPVVDILDPVKSVITLMFRSGHWQLPVVDAGRFVGVITLERIAKRMLRKDL